MSKTIFEPLELLVDDVSDAVPHWEAIVEEATGRKDGNLGGHDRRRPRGSRVRAIRGAIVMTSVATAVLVGMALAPGSASNCKTSILACAAAAVDGAGPVVHLTMGIAGPDSNAANPYPSTADVWYDTGSGAYRSSTRFAGVTGTSEWWETPDGVFYTNTYDPKTNSYPSDGAVRRIGSVAESGAQLPDYSAVRFFGSYKEQLEEGKATLAGTITFHGHNAYMIDFPFVTDHDPITHAAQAVATRVVVDQQTFEPLGIGQAIPSGRWIPFFADPKKGENGPKFDVSERIVAASFEQRAPGEFDLP